MSVFCFEISNKKERVASTAGQFYNKRRLRLPAPVAESIIVMHESQRICARPIVETLPLSTQEIIRKNLHRAGALSDEGVDNASECLFCASSDNDVVHASVPLGPRLPVPNSTQFDCNLVQIVQVLHTNHYQSIYWAWSNHTCQFFELQFGTYTLICHW
jgi:hypothetical protein